MYIYIYIYIYVYIYIYIYIYSCDSSYIYSGTSNSGHFGGPSLVAVALEVTDVWRFYMNILFLSKRLVGRSGRGTKNDS